MLRSLYGEYEKIFGQMATTFDRGTAATFATAAPADQKGTDLNDAATYRC